MYIVAAASFFFSSFMRFFVRGSETIISTGKEKGFFSAVSRLILENVGEIPGSEALDR